MRVTTFPVDSKFLVELFREGSYIADFDERLKVIEGIPKGAVLRDIRYIDEGANRGVLQLLVEHESFPELGDGDSIWTTHTKEVLFEREIRPIDDD